MSSLISRIATRTRTEDKDVATFFLLIGIMLGFFSSVCLDQVYYGGLIEPLRGLSRIETLEGWESIQHANPVVHESLLWGYVVQTDERLYLTSLSSRPELIQVLEARAN
ncbi:hypothetical protein KBC55_00870 [Patescibacteria group bacterium]|nr:hypothetical protein [Patescibacteria group bacterium]